MPRRYYGLPRTTINAVVQLDTTPRTVLGAKSVILMMLGPSVLNVQEYQWTARITLLFGIIRETLPSVALSSKQ